MRLSSSAALARFGLGPREGSLSLVGSDPQGFLEAELAKRVAAVEADVDLPDGPSAFVAHGEYARDLRMAANGPIAATSPSAVVAMTPSVPSKMLLSEVAARIAHVLDGPSTHAGFVERLVWFWTNHFAVSAAKSGQLVVLAGPYEREAIRPNVFGRFEDMLIAAETHPAMLLYLDNANSIGPNSSAGRRRRRGLNENLAREILELHTLGVDGGFSQADVTSLSRLLTGWTLTNIGASSGRPGAFTFNPWLHEPGPHRLLGANYADETEQGGIAALRTLARHPATARRIAFKLARHFVSDAPPPGLVTKLEGVFRETGGDLYAVSLALLRAPEAWSDERSKLRSPREFVVAAMRLPGGFAADKRPNAFMVYLASLGEPLWTPPAPNGFPDAFDSWASPEGLVTRLDVAARLANRVQSDYRDVVEAAFGDDPAAVSEETRLMMAGAESRQQAATILLMSPEFQRR